MTDAGHGSLAATERVSDKSQSTVFTSTIAQMDESLMWLAPEHIRAQTQHLRDTPQPKQNIQRTVCMFERYAAYGVDLCRSVDQLCEVLWGFSEGRQDSGFECVSGLVSMFCESLLSHLSSVSARVNVPPNSRLFHRSAWSSRFACFSRSRLREDSPERCRQGRVADFDVQPPSGARESISDPGADLPFPDMLVPRAVAAGGQATELNLKSTAFMLRPEADTGDSLYQPLSLRAVFLFSQVAFPFFRKEQRRHLAPVVRLAVSLLEAHLTGALDGALRLHVSPSLLLGGLLDGAGKGDEAAAAGARARAGCCCTRCAAARALRAVRGLRS